MGHKNNMFLCILDLQSALREANSSDLHLHAIRMLIHAVSLSAAVFYVKQTKQLKRQM